MKPLDKAAYTTGILFYFSLFAGVVLFVSVLASCATSDQMKDVEEAAKLILKTPDLTAKPVRD
jgi:hypothetical protein